MHIKVIINPASAKINQNRRKKYYIIKKLQAYNKQIKIIYTSNDENSTEKKQLLANIKDCEKIIIVGGDGTINRVIKTCIEENINVPIGLIPFGTANVFALEHNIPFKPSKALDLIFNSGEPQKIDIGVIDDGKNKYYFLLMVGIGIDAQAVLDINPKIKRIFGKATYLASGMKSLVTYRPKRIFIKSNIDGDILHGHTVIVSNSRLYGGNFSIAPFADMQDGMLDICIFKTPYNIMYLKHLISASIGTHLLDDNISYNKSDYLEIWSNEESNIPFQYDGEPGGTLPIKISILPKRIPFIINKNDSRS